MTITNHNTNGWISVEEKLPPHEVWVITYSPLYFDAKIIGAKYSHLNVFNKPVFDCGKDFVYPTHWTYIPKLPKIKGLN